MRNRRSLKTSSEMLVEMQQFRGPIEWLTPISNYCRERKISPSQFFREAIHTYGQQKIGDKWPKIEGIV